MGNPNISRNQTLNQRPSPGQLVGTEYVYNPYSNKYQPIQDNKKRPRLVQNVLRTHENDCSFWIGDTITDKPAHSDTRIVLHNCNGGFGERDDNFLKSKFSNYVTNHAHFLSLVETKINISNSKQMSKIISAYDEVTRGGQLTCTNTPHYPSQRGSQPGGVLGAVFGRLHQRLQKTGKDAYGRWVYHQFVGKNGTLRIYSLYRVINNYDTQTGLTTAWAQQRRELLDNNIDTNPRKHVITSLISELQHVIDDGISILVVADLNEPINSVEKTNVMQHRIGDGLPATRIPGSNAIDHIWASSHLLPLIHKAGYSPLHYFNKSDHRALILDIDLHGILDKDLVSIKNKAERKLRISMPHRMKSYVQYVIAQWNYHKITTRIQDLSSNEIDQSTPEFMTKLNNLDIQISEIMSSGEKNCSRVPSGTSMEWSPKLHEAIENVRQCQYNLKCVQRCNITTPI